MNITEALDFIIKKNPNPTEGLPDEVFYFISKNT